MLVADAGMPGPSDASYGQQPASYAGFFQPPADQAMMPGFPQPSSGEPSSGTFPVAAPRNPPVPAAYSQPVPPVNVTPRPAGEYSANLLVYIAVQFVGFLSCSTLLVCDGKII